TGDADPQRVGDEGLGRLVRHVRHLAGSDPGEMRDDFVDDGIGYLAHTLTRPRAPSPAVREREERRHSNPSPAPRERVPSVARRVRVRLQSSAGRKTDEGADIGEGVEAEDRLAQFAGP